MDEFNKAAEEYTPLQDEFNESGVAHGEEKQTNEYEIRHAFGHEKHRKHNRLRIAMQFFTVSVVSVSILASAVEKSPMVVIPPFFVEEEGMAMPSEMIAESSQDETKDGTQRETEESLDTEESKGIEETQETEETGETKETLDTEESQVTEETQETGETGEAEESQDGENNSEPIVDIRTVTCEECGGTGIYCPGDPNFGYSRGNGHGYDGCGGTGYSPCPDIWCKDGIRFCEVCKGTGKDTGGEDCRNCRGTGNVVCDFCNGTGIAACITADSHVECVACGGGGVVLVN